MIFNLENHDFGMVVFHDKPKTFTGNQVFDS